MKPVLLGVAGGSGSGKTTIVKKLVDALGDQTVLVLALDHYYHDLSHLSASERDARNFDHPDAIDWLLLSEHLEKLAGGDSIIRPTYSFKTHTREEPVSISPKPAIVIDGILTLYPAAIRALMKLSIFVDTVDDLRFIRRLRRDVAERGRTNDSVINQYLGSVRPMYAQYVMPQRDVADLVIPWEHYNETAISSLVHVIRGLLTET